MKQTEIRVPVSSARINRTRARAWAIQMHYQWDVSKNGNSLSQTLEDILANRRVSAIRIPYVKRIASNLDRYGTQVDDSLNGVLEIGSPCSYRQGSSQDSSARNTVLQ